MTQRRWYCHVCQREWVFARSTPEGICPAPDCGAVGFVERIDVRGHFDRDTPITVIDTPEQEAARGRLRSHVEFVEPPTALVHA